MGPHRATALGAAEPAAPAQPRCLRSWGKKNAIMKRMVGVGPNPQVVGGEDRLCRKPEGRYSWGDEERCEIKNRRGCRDQGEARHRDRGVPPSRVRSGFARPARLSRTQVKAARSAAPAPGRGPRGPLRAPEGNAAPGRARTARDHGAAMLQDPGGGAKAMGLDRPRACRPIGALPARTRLPQSGPRRRRNARECA